MYGTTDKSPSRHLHAPTRLITPCEGGTSELFPRPRTVGGRGFPRPAHRQTKTQISSSRRSVSAVSGPISMVVFAFNSSSSSLSC